MNENELLNDIKSVAPEVYKVIIREFSDGNTIMIFFKYNGIEYFAQVSRDGKYTWTDSFNEGARRLPNSISRKYEELVKSYYDKVNFSRRNSIMNKKFSKLLSKLNNFAPSIEDVGGGDDNSSFLVTDSGTQCKFWNISDDILGIKGIIQFDKPFSPTDYKLIANAVGQFEAYLAKKGFNVKLNKDPRLEKFIAESDLQTPEVLNYIK